MCLRSCPLSGHPQPTVRPRIPRCAGMTGKPLAPITRLLSPRATPPGRIARRTAFRPSPPRAIRRSGRPRRQNPFAGAEAATGLAWLRRRRGRCGPLRRRGRGRRRTAAELIEAKRACLARAARIVDEQRQEARREPAALDHSRNLLRQIALWPLQSAVALEAPGDPPLSASAWLPRCRARISRSSRRRRGRRRSWVVPSMTASRSGGPMKSSAPSVRGGTRRSGGNLNFPLVMIGAPESYCGSRNTYRSLGGVRERARNSTPAQRLKICLRYWELRHIADRNRLIKRDSLKLAE